MVGWLKSFCWKRTLTIPSQIPELFTAAGLLPPRKFFLTGKEDHMNLETIKTQISLVYAKPQADPVVVLAARDHTAEEITSTVMAAVSLHSTLRRTTNR